MATEAQVIAQAHRRLGVLSAEEAPTDDMVAYGAETLALILAELRADGLPLVSVGGVVADGLALPLAMLLATDLAPHYEVPPRDARSRCVARLRAILYPDDRPDPAPVVDDYGFWDVADDEGRARWASYF